MSFINQLPKENEFDRSGTCRLLAQKAIEVAAEMNQQGLQVGDCFPSAGLLFAVSAVLRYDFALVTIAQKMQIPCEDAAAISPEDGLSFLFAGLAEHHLKSGDRLCAGVLSNMAILLTSEETSTNLVDWLQRYVFYFELQLKSKWN